MRRRFERDALAHALTVVGLEESMQRRMTTFIVMAAAAIALSANPAAAQRRDGGNSGGGRVAGARAAARVSPGRGTIGRAVPRGGARPRVVRPSVSTRTTVITPSHLAHGGAGRFGLRTGLPRSYGYAPYGYASPWYSSGYSSGNYGGYGRGGHARLRILGVPRNGEVYVDGAYAGLVDAFDGVFQHLELTPGPHRIEIRAPGGAPIVFDVQAQGGRTLTYRAR